MQAPRRHSGPYELAPIRGAAIFSTETNSPSLSPRRTGSCPCPSELSLRASGKILVSRLAAARGDASARCSTVDEEHFDGMLFREKSPAWVLKGGYALEFAHQSAAVAMTDNGILRANRAMACVPASAQSASRLNCAAESGINRIVALRAPPDPVILPGSRAFARPFLLHKSHLEKNNAALTPDVVKSLCSRR
jgi:hypothetical protein